MKHLLVVASMLTACASAPKPNLPDSYYDSFARRIVLTMRCSEMGLMAPDLASLGASYLRANLDGWSFDLDRMRATTDRWGLSTPTAADCNNTAMEIHTRKREIELNNAAVAANQKAWADAVNASQPRKPIYCNTIGTQTVCN